MKIIAAILNIVFIHVPLMLGAVVYEMYQHARGRGKVEELRKK